MSFETSVMMLFLNVLGAANIVVMVYILLFLKRRVNPTLEKL
ncbi:hypothetical protein JCM19314_2637 [Nonlabens ulvanivorans]|uniref:Uncharacterized protein n=1 Tax=Nonlabens ulvanivorans TaxID=906888 RepID=A0A081D735_NONUL|nr:hypothetical protein JCM19296_309 [Nonlabens ulvanivorans]GAK98606.1 hypothetical protein JCM19314_2637 [Nonlabens ulvanivorans]